MPTVKHDGLAPGQEVQGRTTDQHRDQEDTFPLAARQDNPKGVASRICGEVASGRVGLGAWAHITGERPPLCSWCAIPMERTNPEQSLCAPCKRYAEAGRNIEAAADLFRGGGA